MPPRRRDCARKRESLRLWSTEKPVRPHEAIWLNGPVPARFWEDRTHRLLYLRWLGQKMRFRKPEDWYRISTQLVKRNRGSGVLNGYYDGSAIRMLKDLMPENDWREWLFQPTAGGFWRDPKNCRRYLQWLGAKLGYQQPEDWHRITTWDFHENRGATLLQLYTGLIYEGPGLIGAINARLSEEARKAGGLANLRGRAAGAWAKKPLI